MHRRHAAQRTTPFELLPWSKCRFPARERRTFPRAVIFKRFAADFFVLMPFGRRINQTEILQKERAI